MKTNISMKSTSIIVIGLFLSVLKGWSQTDLEWDDYFMPGLGYKVYDPKNDSLGIYQGVITEFVIYARAKGSASKKTGPSRIKSYGDLSIIKSNKENIRDVFYCNLGLIQNIGYDWRSRYSTFDDSSFMRYILP